MRNFEKIKNFKECNLKKLGRIDVELLGLNQWRHYMAVIKPYGVWLKTTTTTKSSKCNRMDK